MPDAGSQYFGRTSEAEGAPAAGKAGGVFTQKMGPLPVWGWGVVALASFYLYRKIAGGSAAAQQSKTQAAANYPQGGVGGVFLLPGQGGASPAPAPTPTPTPTPGHHFTPTPDTLRAIGHSLIEFNNTVFPQPLTPEGSAFLQSVASSPNPSQTEDFITQNVANKALGLPYIVGAGSWGSAGVLDPRTGTVTPLAQ